MKRSLAVLGTIVALAACEKKPVSIAVTPPTAKLEKAGASQGLSATGIDADGAKLPVQPTWASSDPKVASVDASGKVTAVGSGVATITATQEQAKGAAAITVEIASSIKVDPADVKVTKAEDKPKVTATVVNEKGVALTGKPLTFTVADTSIATVDPTGVVSGVKDGVTSLSVSSGALKAEAKVEVSGLAKEEPKTAAKGKEAKGKKHK